MRTAPGWIALLATTGLVATAAVHADDNRDAKRWLDRMSQAMRNLNYEGTFIYWHNNRMEAMRIVHAVKDGNEHERLVALSGPKREVVRTKDSVICVLPSTGRMVVNTEFGEGLFPSVLDSDVSSLESSYELKVLGTDRIARLQSRVIGIKPRDRYRYGYRLWLDVDSALLLKSSLMDHRGRPIEELMFTSINIGSRISDEQLEADREGERVLSVPREQKQQPSAVQSSRPGVGQQRPNWSLSRTPPGFKLTMHRRGGLDTKRDILEHMVLSDGLASVSVYIAPTSGKSRHPLEGYSELGAVKAYGTVRDDHHITVVGEVPQQTIDRIAQSVHLRGEGG